jgi:hypothetical protein
MRYELGALSLFCLIITSYGFQSAFTSDRREMMTSFQGLIHYSDQYDIGTNVAILYFEDNDTDIIKSIKSWADRGYEPWVMFNSSQDYTGAYVKGDYDGKEHFDEVQLSADESYKTVFSEGAYMVPNPNWLQYHKDFVRRAIEAGAKAVVPEEPEFFSTAGHSSVFKEAWKQEYGEDWIDPTTNDTTRWMSRRLMAKLYERHLDAVLTYAKSLDSSVKCIIAAHSPIDYAVNPMVYPHAKTSKLKALDGYIAQAWSDTARTSFVDPTKDGAEVENAFLKGFLEYNYFWNLMRDTGKELIYLQDPKSDSPGFSWHRYRRWYEETVIASSIFSATDYEVMPWPDRFFVPDAPAKQKTACLTVVRAMQDLPNYASDYSTHLATLISDTMLWTSPELHEAIVGLVGMSVTPLRDGVPIDVIPIERASDVGFLDGYKVLFMSYDSWLPESKSHQDAIANWVKKGGMLAFLGGSRYTDIEGSWWKKMNLAEPQDALFKDLGVELASTQVKIQGNTLASLDDSHPLVKQLGNIDLIPRCEYFYSYNSPSAHWMYGADGKNLPVMFEQKAGAGLFLFIGVPPHFLIRSTVGADIIRAISRYLSAKAGSSYAIKNQLSVRRGPYHIVYATRDEVSLKGNFIDLLDPKLPLIQKKNLNADQYAFLYEINPLPNQIQILYSSSIIDKDLHVADKSRFQVSGPFKTVGVVTIYSPNLDPRAVSAKDGVTGRDLLIDWMWNENGRALTIEYNHAPNRHKVDVLVEW